MTRVERMWKAIEEAKKALWNKNDSYQLRASEIYALCEQMDEDGCRGIGSAYRYGFIKGIRYQKAQEKKKRKAVRA